MTASEFQKMLKLIKVKYQLVINIVVLAMANIGQYWENQISIPRYFMQKL